MDFPVSEEFTIRNPHKKLITSISINPSGSRFLTCSLDSYIKMWSFAGMSKRITYFRKINVEEGIGVNCVRWNPQGNHFIACPSCSSARLYDREGIQIDQTPKGDMYLKDLKHTAGHISIINGVCWDRKDNSKFMTWADDGTARLWDVNKMKRNISVLKLKNRQNVKFECTAATYDGTRRIIAGGREGTIHIWDYKRPLRAKVIKNAHSKNENISALLVEGERLYSRSCDGTLKIWDFRNLKTLVLEKQIPNDIVHSKTEFTPDQKHIITIKNESGTRGFKNSSIILLNKKTLDIEEEIEIQDDTVVTFDWNRKINQIMTATKNRNIVTYYSEEKSSNGVKLCAKEAEYVVSETEFVPHFDKKLIMEARRLRGQDPELPEHKHDKPQMSKDELNKHIYGKVSFCGALLQKEKRRNLRDENPRKALLRYNKIAKENPMFILEDKK